MTSALLVHAHTMPSETPTPELTAHYTTPTSAQAWTYPQQSTTSTPSTDKRVAYLAKLRKDVSLMQNEINRFLTNKMEEDKRVAGSDGGGASNGVYGKGKVDEKAEEDNYGEEGEDD